MTAILYCHSCLAFKFYNTLDISIKWSQYLVEIIIYFFKYTLGKQNNQTVQLTNEKVLAICFANHLDVNLSYGFYKALETTNPKMKSLASR